MRSQASPPAGMTMSTKLPVLVLGFGCDLERWEVHCMQGMSVGGPDTYCCYEIAI